MRQKLSIIIPTYNEQDNLLPLVKRLHKTLEASEMIYEIIVVDDNSTDKTLSIIKKLAKEYPLKLYKKKGKKGKAHSLIEGFSYATYDLLCMIDADLQYPPEVIPEMVAKLETGADVIVSNRKQYFSSKLRKVISSSFRSLFAKFFFGLDHDVQSGLKVFKKEVFETIAFVPQSGWTFDLEFLHRAAIAGFIIKDHDIIFSERKSGNSKISFLKTSFEIGFNALKTRLKEIDPLHLSPQNKSSMEGAGIRFKKNKYVTHTTLPHHVSAIKTFHDNQTAAIAVILMLFIGFLVYDPLKALLGLIAVLSAIYFVDVVFNLFVVWKSLYFEKALSFDQKELETLDESKLPVYSILCPLYKEAHVIPQFVNAISKLDWPKDKLDVMLLLEADDVDSIEAVKTMSLPSFVRTVIVPDSLPKTKPKACNYGLAKAKGEYLVIFDAEDIPDVDQLKKAYLGFRKAGKNVLCLQAKLNYYNPHHNLLTRLFTAEYSLWFDVSLTGLQSLNTSLPLGGTSNHFKTKDLKKLQGWDPFNVTEDADLGIRLFKKGYKTAIIESTTLEEANSKVKNWIRQRSRWIKGYMQTYLVHTRELFGFNNPKKRHSLIFHLVIGGKIAFILINPLLWLATIAYFTLYSIVGPTIEYLYPSYVFYMAATSLIMGNFLFIYYYMIGAIKREQWGLIKFVFFVPFYWLLISSAGYMALYQLLFKPHYWEKTIHGFHLLQNTAKSKPSLLYPKVSQAIQTSHPIIIFKRHTAFLNQMLRKINLTSVRKLPTLITQIKGHYLSGGILVVSLAFANFLNFVFNAYLGRVLTYETFGLVSLINSFMYLTTIPFAALNLVVNNRIAFFEEKYGETVAFGFWSNLRKNLLIISLVTSVLWLIISPFLVSYFKIENLLPILLFTPVWIFGFLVAANKGYLKGKLLFTLTAVITVLDPAVKLIGSFILVNGNLTEWVYITIPLSLVAVFLVSTLFISRFKKNPVNKDTLHVKFPNKLFLASILYGISSMIFLSLDVILAKHFLSVEDSGKYALISLTGKMVFFISTLFTIFITPFVSKNEGAKKDSSYILHKSLTVASCLAILGFIFVGLLGQYTVPFMFGNKAYAIVPYLLPFSFAISCFAVSTVFISYYLSRKIYTFSLVTFLLAVLQIVALNIFHHDIAAFVRVMLFIGYANLALVILLHFTLNYVMVFENNVKDFLAIFTKDKTLEKESKNLRILIFNWRDTRHKWAGGAELYVQEIAQRWVKEGNNVTIFCGNDNHSPKNQVINGVQIVRRGGFITVYVWAVLYYLLKFRDKFDIIIDAENGIPFLTPLYVRKPVFLLIHHVHQEVFRRHLIFPLSVIASFIEGKMMPFLYRSRTIITVSQSSKEEIIKLGFPIDNIHVVYPGIDHDIFFQREKAKLPVFAYLGRLQKYKNVDILVKAFAKVVDIYPTAQLYIAGVGESTTMIKKLINTLNLKNNVTLLGKVTEQEKIELLGYAWAALQPSQIEGWGITVIETNACGTPVIASNVNGLRDSIVNGKTGILVEPKNIPEFSKVMLEVISNTELRNNLSHEAYVWSQNFSWERSTEEITNIINFSLKTRFFAGKPSPAIVVNKKNL